MKVAQLSRAGLKEEPQRADDETAMKPRRFSLARSLAALILALLCAALAAQDSYHTVVKGDTLFSLSRSYGLSVDALRKANGLGESAVLKVGQKLRIPGAASPAPSVRHTVVKGDTLYGIARTYSVGLDAILKANKLSKDSALKIGQVLTIPGAQGAAAAASPPSTSAKPAAASPAAGAGSAKAPSWPLEGKRSYLSGKLYGIGISASSGAPVRAVAAGTVIHAAPYQGYGQVVFVERKDKLIYAYAGLGSISVRVGESIPSGAKLGELPALSGGESPSLSFMVFKGGKAMDPATAPRD